MPKGSGSKTHGKEIRKSRDEDIVRSKLKLNKNTENIGDLN